MNHSHHTPKECLQLEQHVQEYCIAVHLCSLRCTLAIRNFYDTVP
jgi:hypothetical protein